MERRDPGIILGDGGVCCDETFVGGLGLDNVDVVVVRTRRFPWSEWEVREIVPRGEGEE